MRNLILFAVVLLCGCGEKAQRYHIDEITSPSNKLTYLKKDMSLVNGIVFCEFGDMGLFKEGKEAGVLKGWHEGHLIYEYNYKEGKEDGILKHYYENGQLMWKCNYTDGEKVSEKCWNEAGNEIPCED